MPQSSRFSWISPATWVLQQTSLTAQLTGYMKQAIEARSLGTFITVSGTSGKIAGLFKRVTTRARLQEDLKEIIRKNSQLIFDDQRFIEQELSPQSSLSWWRHIGLSNKGYSPGLGLDISVAGITVAFEIAAAIILEKTDLCDQTDPTVLYNKTLAYGLMAASFGINQLHDALVSYNLDTVDKFQKENYVTITERLRIQAPFERMSQGSTTTNSDDTQSLRTSLRAGLACPTTPTRSLISDGSVQSSPDDDSMTTYYSCEEPERPTSETSLAGYKR